MAFAKRGCKLAGCSPSVGQAGTPAAVTFSALSRVRVVPDTLTPRRPVEKQNKVFRIRQSSGRIAVNWVEGFGGRTQLLR